MEYLIEIDSESQQGIINGIEDDLNRISGVYSSTLNCDNVYESGFYRCTTMSGTLPSGFSSTNVILEVNRSADWVIQKIYHLQNPNDIFIRYCRVSTSQVYGWMPVTVHNASLVQGYDIDTATDDGYYTVGSPTGTLPPGWSATGSYYLTVRSYGSTTGTNGRFVMQTLQRFYELNIMAYRVYDRDNQTMGAWYIVNGDIINGGTLSNKQVVCFGDSITGNYIPPLDYPSILEGITGARCHNVGFGGCTMAKGSFRTPFSMAGLAESIEANDYTAQDDSGISITYAAEGTNSFQPTTTDYVPIHMATLKAIDWSAVDYAIIFYGTNDFTNASPIDNANDKYDKTTFKGAFRYSYEVLMAKNPGIRVIPIAPMWRWYPDASPYADSDTRVVSGHYLHDYVVALQEVAAEYHLPVLNMYDVCGFNKHNRLAYFYGNDGTHPKRHGVNIFTRKIANDVMYGTTR
jgi:lysophospholipase L1-like esterase